MDEAGTGEALIFPGLDLLWLQERRPHLTFYLYRVPLLCFVGLVLVLGMASASFFHKGSEIQKFLPGIEARLQQAKTSTNESTAGADASMEVPKLHNIKLLIASFYTHRL